MSKLTNCVATCLQVVSTLGPQGYVSPESETNKYNKEIWTEEWLSYFAEIEIFPRPPLENVQHILQKYSKWEEQNVFDDDLSLYQTGGLKVRGGVVRLGDEELGLGARVDGGKHVTDLQELLLDRPQQVETGLDLSLRVCSLHRCCNHCYKPAFACHLRQEKS